MKMRRIMAVLLACCMLLPLTVFAAEAETEVDLNQLAVSYMEEIPETAFGGMYYNEAGQLVVNIKEDSAVSIAVPLSDDVVVKTVQYSLAELEAMKDCFEPYMQEYHIVTLDADEVNNTVAIEVTQDDESIYALIESLEDIDPSIVTVTVLSSDFVIENTVVHCDEIEIGEVPDEFAGMYEENSERAVGSSVTIYPGMKIYVKKSTGYNELTAGPRYNSTTFCTAGHGVGDIGRPTVYSATYTEIGTVSSYTFGSSGDHCFVGVGGSGVLPSSNTLYAQTGRYTISPSGLVGNSVEMWGGNSGITSGKITATNLTANVSGTTVKGLSSASYTCQGGDSGAAVFSAGVATDSAGLCYGIQSAGSNKGSNGVYQTSYFSPLA